MRGTRRCPNRTRISWMTRPMVSRIWSRMVTSWTAEGHAQLYPVGESRKKQELETRRPRRDHRRGLQRPVAAPDLYSSQLRTPPVLYSVTRVSKKFFSCLLYTSPSPRDS